MDFAHRTKEFPCENPPFFKAVERLFDSFLVAFGLEPDGECGNRRIGLLSLCQTFRHEFAERGVEKEFVVELRGFVFERIEFPFYGERKDQASQIPVRENRKDFHSRLLGDPLVDQVVADVAPEDEVDVGKEVEYGDFFILGEEVVGQYAPFPFDALEEIRIENGTFLHRERFVGFVEEDFRLDFRYGGEEFRGREDFFFRKLPIIHSAVAVLFRKAVENVLPWVFPSVLEVFERQERRRIASKDGFDVRTGNERSESQFRRLFRRGQEGNGKSREGGIRILHGAYHFGKP